MPAAIRSPPEHLSILQLNVRGRLANDPSVLLEVINVACILQYNLTADWLLRYLLRKGTCCRPSLPSNSKPNKRSCPKAHAADKSAHQRQAQQTLLPEGTCRTGDESSDGVGGRDRRWLCNVVVVESEDVGSGGVRWREMWEGLL